MAESATGIKKGDHVKFDIRLPMRMGRRVARICRELGLPKNAFLTVAVAALLAELGPVVPEGAANREKLMMEIQKVFQRILKRMKSEQ